MSKQSPVGPSPVQASQSIRLINNQVLEITQMIGFNVLQKKHPIEETIMVRPGTYQYRSRKTAAGQIWVVISFSHVECGLPLNDIVPE